jgi:YD repeat-containing protein
MPYSQTTQSYAWRPSSSLVGQEFYIYGALQDGIVTVGGYSTQKVHIEAAGSFNLLSGVFTTNSNYTYQYIYNGTAYSGTTTLQPGQNVVTITTSLPGGGTVAHQITVTKVASLVPSQSYTYDELNRKKTYINGNGITTSYTYDMAGNLVQTSASNGNVVSFTYDNSNRKMSMVDNTGTTFYDYDDLDRITAITYAADNKKADGLVLSYAYDNANRVTDLYYPGGEHIQFTWDDAARLTAANDLTTGQNTSYTYDYTTGLLKSMSRANGITTKYFYNGSGLLDDIQHWMGSTLISEYNYTLDATGNATALLTTFPDGSQKQELYTYDGVHRLCQVVYGSTASASSNDKTVIYTYDGNSNRLTATTKVNGTVTQALSYTYGLDNQLSSITDQNSNVVASFVYDSAGNRIQKITPTGNTYYSYDERNLLTAVLSPSHYITYAYNGAGQRQAMVYDGTTTQYIIDPRGAAFQVVQERSGGTITRNHVFGIDRLETNVLPSGSSSYYLSDRIGSVRLITGSTGSVVSSQNYDVFGALQ